MIQFIYVSKSLSYFKCTFWAVSLKDPPIVLQYSLTAIILSLSLSPQKKKRENILLWSPSMAGGQYSRSSTFITLPLSL